MAVHRIWGYIAPDSGMTESEIQAAIDDWVAARTKWEGEYTATVTRANTADPGTSGTEYLAFQVDFRWDSADKANTLQKCADKLKEKVDWFALVYHECTNDRGVNSDCSWAERWNWPDGPSIPSRVDARVPDCETVVNA